MNSFIKLNLFISILLLFSLIASINEVTSVAIERADDFCKGFEYTSPKGGITVKNNTQITASWTKGESQIETIGGIELFGEGNKGLLATLWDGIKDFGSDGTATEDTTIVVPSNVELPQSVMLRTWGFTKKGPNCFVLTGSFTLTA